MTKPTKRIIFSCGGKGGVGKTTVATAIADFYATRAIPATLFDCDTENKHAVHSTTSSPPPPSSIFVPSADSTGLSIPC